MRIFDKVGDKMRMTIIKKFLAISWVWVFLLALIVGLAPVYAGKIQEFTILYTGGVQGELEPCG